MQVGPPRRRRARPVADAPIDALLLGAEDLTKGWLLALLEQAELDDAPRILAADLTRDGPRVCDAVVRAVTDDTDLRRLQPGGALEPLVSRVGELAGARTPEEISRAADTLHAVVWSALREELRRPDVDQVSEIVERLATVIELVRGAALRRAADEGGEDGARERRTKSPDEGGEEGAGATVSTGRFGHPRPTTPASAPAPPPEPEREPPTGQPAAGAQRSDAAPVIGRCRVETGAVSAHGALWIGALEDEIKRSEQYRSPLSLLLAELEDANRIAAVESHDGATATFGRFAQAVRGVARREDILVCETETRAWIIARDTGRAGAQALGARIAGAVGAAPPWRGAAMVASVGVAVLGEEGHRAAELIEAAEEARFTASASGIGITSGPIGPTGPTGPTGPEGSCGTEGGYQPPSDRGPRLVS